MGMIAWDTGHGNIHHHQDLVVACDQGIAALIKDLKLRGLLDETLVLWGGEFGRAPTSEGNKGRDQDHYGFTVWMAGGGVKPGFSYGATDAFGCSAVQDRVHVHDLHATILHLMGLDHEKLTFIAILGEIIVSPTFTGESFMTSSPKGVTSSTYLTLDTELKCTTPNPRFS